MRPNPRAVFQGEPGELVALEANLKDHTIEAVCSTLTGELKWVFRADHEDRAVEKFGELLPEGAKETWAAYLKELQENKADLLYVEEQTRLDELTKLTELRKARERRAAAQKEK